MPGISKAERFALATDQLLQGAGPQTNDEELTANLALAGRLTVEAGGAAPDPAFVGGLRRQLLARASAVSSKQEAGIRYAVIETELGRLGFAYRAGKVFACSLVELETVFERAVAANFGTIPVREARPPSMLERGIRAHLAGRRRFTAIDLSGLPAFQRRVLEKTCEIPRGEVRPYGWVAREIGAPGAVRAVGTALGQNPVPFLIPCHRVVRSDGTLGEYSGGGPAEKARVLLSEGAPLGALRQSTRGGERLRGCSTTHIFCYPSCHAAQRVAPDHRVPFASTAAARARGYRPCKLCRPD